MSLDYMSIVISLVFSSSVGIIFEFYPSRKALNLKPIDATFWTSFEAVIIPDVPHVQQ